MELFDRIYDKDAYIKGTIINEDKNKKEFYVLWDNGVYGTVKEEYKEIKVLGHLNLKKFFVVDILHTGKDGKEFKICKFRSMSVDAEKDGIARLSTGVDDNRVTPVGRIIRKCRIDELPQLWNILKGDMSVVGPRPERPEIAEQYYRIMPDFKLRLQVKAGLTGYAQIYGKYNTDPYEKLEYDLMYIKDMSVLIDLRLIFATFRILFKSESACWIQ